MIEKLNNVSSTAVKKATSRDWDEWVIFLDNVGAETLDHKEIVSIVKGAGDVTNEWWQQMVTVGYEFTKGRRTTGQTADAGFQLGVQRVVPIAQDKLWDLLFSEAGVKTWLGNTGPFTPEPDFALEDDGQTVGEIRTVKSRERVRMVLHPSHLDHPIVVQLTLSCPRNAENKTTLRFHIEKLFNEQEREQMRDHWRSVLDAIHTLATERIGG
ncbi:MAG: hypothetical protein QNJ97_13495 [Myxococcota bacterium]|nr:hypothetical protein [Myxococcota bacterium]